MSGIVKLFEGTIHTIEAKVKSGEVATPHIIGFILRDTTSKAQSVLVKAALPPVQDMCIKGYQQIGWDFERNRSMTDQPPSLDQVMDFFRNTSAKIRAWIQEQHAGLDPTPQELSDLAEACNRLWQLDFNRLKPENEDYQINLQQGKNFGDQRDVARQPLFTYVKPEALKQPTFASFIALLDNYSAQTGQRETVTREESAENTRFINAIYTTPCLQYLHRYLIAKGLATPNAEQFKVMLHNIWFQLYGRTRGVQDSSGFEHVFVGEIKDGKVVGLHNWIQIYLQEKAGKFDYKGYVSPRVRGGKAFEHDEYEQLLSVNFDWNNVTKDASTVFIGTSPEFEVALYTLVFLMSVGERAEVHLGPYRAEITCYKYTMQGKEFVGTSFPGLPPLDRDEAATKIQSQFRGMQSRRLYS